MKRKFLTDLGITDADVIKAIVEYHQCVVQDAAEALKAVNDDLDVANKTIKKLKEETHVPDEKEWVKKSELDVLQAKYDADTAAKDKALADYKADVEAKSIESTKREAVLKHLIADGAKASSAELMLLKVDLSKIEIENEKIKGWDDLSKPLKESYADHFGKVQETGADTAKPPSGGDIQKNPWLKESRSLEAQTKLYRENPELAIQMAKAAGVLIE